MPYVAALKRVYEVQRAWIKKTRRQMLSAIARVAGIPLVEAQQQAEDPDLLHELTAERQRMETGGGDFEDHGLSDWKPGPNGGALSTRCLRLR